MSAFAAAHLSCSLPAGTVCTEAIMLAHGFTVAQMVELVRAGLATAQAERVAAPGYRGDRTRVWITQAGRRVLGRQST
jgi:hypothetical protein